MDVDQRELPLAAMQELARHMTMPGANPRRALAAVLEAWPSAKVLAGPGLSPSIVLPLTNPSRRD